MILKTFLNQYINEENVEDIIFHSGSIILKDTIKTIVFLGVCYGIFYWLQTYVHWPLLPWIFWGIGTILLIRYAIQIFDKYIDCIVLSKNWITFFSWDGLRKYKTEFFWWDSIESISHQQTTFRDKLFFKGDIKIKLDHDIEYEFTQVNTPKKYIKKIIKLKEHYLIKKEQEEERLGEKGKENEQLEILSEALSDVIKEYLEKKQS